ncbi:MAG: glutamate--tRNA ligase [Rhodobacteraceae bacterium]|nr:glutamate--tRNA ligase [Paracoccaceae bacterium]
MTITRFAPSPTGHLHVGNVRTALFNFLISRGVDGEFILRLDDTDAERSRPEFVESIHRDLEWLGLHWSRVERQSERIDLYHAAADQLRKKDRLYECFESPSELALRRKTLLSMGRPPIYDRNARNLSTAEQDRLRRQAPGYWRFLLSGERVEWQDGIQGAVSIDSSSLSDPVLIRADEQFLYTLASVVDDLDMGITHIVRGSDHVTNTATQIQLMHCLTKPAPSFAHHSLLTGPQGEPLGKRMGALSIRELREKGIEPMALLSQLAFIGSGKPIQLCGSLDELADHFELASFSSAPVKFDESDLVGLTARSLARLSFEEIADEIRACGVNENIEEAFWNAVRGNLTRRSDLATWWKLLRDGASPLVSDEDREFVEGAFQCLPQLPFDDRTWESWTRAVGQTSGRTGRQLYMPLRKALTGKVQGPEMHMLMPLMQKVTRVF